MRNHQRMNLRLRTLFTLTAGLLCSLGSAHAQRDGQIKSLTAADFKVTRYPTKAGMGTRDVAVSEDGSVWFAAQFSGTVGHLDPKTGSVQVYPLGPGSSPHGIVIGPDHALWVMDGGQNAIVRMDPSTHKTTAFRIPRERGDANLNTGVFDHNGDLWFTGEDGVYGRLSPATGKLQVWDAPVGFG